MASSVGLENVTDTLECPTRITGVCCVMLALPEVVVSKTMMHDPKKKT